MTASTCPTGCTVHDCLRCGGSHRHIAGPHACPSCGWIVSGPDDGTVIVSDAMTAARVEYRSDETPDRIAASWARYNADREAAARR